MSSPVNDCVGIDEAVDVVLCWRAFVAGTIEGVCGMDCPFLCLACFAFGGRWRRSSVVRSGQPSPPLRETRHGLGHLIPPGANRSHRLRLST